MSKKKRRPGRRQIERILLDPKLPHNQILYIPGVLYFPPKVLGQLNEICEYNEYTPGQLVAWAFKLQLPHWDDFYNFVMTPLEPGEPEVWPEDPLFALACVAFLHWVGLFIKMMEDPATIDATLEQLKKDAPVEWSFRSPESDNDHADWWKRSETL